MGKSYRAEESFKKKGSDRRSRTHRNLPDEYTEKYTPGSYDYLEDLEEEEYFHEKRRLHSKE